MDRFDCDYLLKDPSVRRWHENVSRGSFTTAAVWIRRVGMVHRRFGKSPQQLAKMTSKQVTNFLMDIVGILEKEGKSGG